MRVDDIVERIRDQCLGFQRVDHALTSTFDEVADAPAAFVSLVAVRPRTDRSMFVGAHVQRLDETVGVYIMLRRTQDDDAGEGANDDLETLRGQLLAALVAWEVPGADEPLSYAGGQLTERQGMASWREDFVTSTEIRITP